MVFPAHSRDQGRCEAVGLPEGLAEGGGAELLLVQGSVLQARAEGAGTFP